MAHENRLVALKRLVMDKLEMVVKLGVLGAGHQVKSGV
jgi:hypothetical protein